MRLFGGNLLSVLSLVGGSKSEECAADEAAAVRGLGMLQKAHELQSSRFGDGEEHESVRNAEESDRVEAEEMWQMRRDSEAEKKLSWAQVQLERRQQFEEALAAEEGIAVHPDLLELADKVFCGQHTAATCAECPGDSETPWAMCNGQCKWHGDGHDGECVKFPHGSEMDGEGRLLIFTEGGVMYRSNVDGSEMRNFVDANTPCPHMKGSHVQNVANKFSSRPVGVAVDESVGKIFWSDWFGGTRVQAIDPSTDPYGREFYRWSFNASIVSTPIDGGELTPIVAAGEVIQPKHYKPIYWKPAQHLGWPYFLSLDRTRQMIYWTDRLDHKIQRCDYSGGALDIDFHATEEEPMGIVVDAAGERIYYSSFNSIYYLSTSGGTSKRLASSVGQIKGMDFDPVQNYLYFASLGTTRNPGGILRVKGYRPKVNLADRCGIDFRGQPSNKKSWASCEHVVYLPAGKDGVSAYAGREGAVSTPVDVKGDFKRGAVFWSGEEAQGGNDGLGGRVYRTNLCETLPIQGKDKPNTDKKPRGDFTVLSEFRGEAFYPPFARGIALFDADIDYKGAAPTPPCQETSQGFEVPNVTSTCFEDYEWKSSTGASCMDYAQKKWCEDGRVGSGWGASWGTFKQWTKKGEKSADEACCVCGYPVNRYGVKDIGSGSG